MPLNMFQYDDKKPFYKQTWFIVGCCVFVTILIVVAIVLGVILSKKKKEGFEQKTSLKDNKVEINGHQIDCNPELKFMEEFIKTSKGIN